jgi:hypothetical protein
MNTLPKLFTFTCKRFGIHLQIVDNQRFPPVIPSGYEPETAPVKGVLRIGEITAEQAISPLSPLPDSITILANPWPP